MAVVIVCGNRVNLVGGKKAKVVKYNGGVGERTGRERRDDSQPRCVADNTSTTITTPRPGQREDGSVWGETQTRTPPR